MTIEDEDMFDAAYAKKTSVEACMEVVKLYDKGLHDTRDRLREREMTHRAIVELARRLDAIEGHFPNKGGAQ